MPLILQTTVSVGTFYSRAFNQPSLLFKPQSHISSSAKLQVRKGGLPPLNPPPSSRSPHSTDRQRSPSTPSLFKPQSHISSSAKSQVRKGGLPPPQPSSPFQATVPQFKLSKISGQEGRFTPASTCSRLNLTCTLSTPKTKKPQGAFLTWLESGPT